MDGILYTTFFWLFYVCNGLHSPNTTHAVSMLISNPDWAYWQALKWIPHNIKWSIRRVLIYNGARWYVRDFPIECYVNLDHTEYLDTKKYLRGYVFNIYGTMANLQNLAVLSIIEENYIVMT